MAKQIIALDIDGVLANWASFGIPRLNELLGKNIKIEECFEFELSKAFKVTKQKIKLAYEQLYAVTPISELATVDGANKAIDLLHQDFNLVAVTARPRIYMDETKYWLKKHFKKDIEFHFGSGAGLPVGGENHRDNKLAICRALKARYLVEDNPEECIKFLDTEIQPLCIEWPWNKSIANHPKIPRGDWKYLTNYLRNEKNRH